jgi:hypothetical protein
VYELKIKVEKYPTCTFVQVEKKGRGEEGRTVELVVLFSVTAIFILRIFRTTVICSK